MVTKILDSINRIKIKTETCHFCEIIDGAREVEKVIFEDELIVVIEDAKPKAPIHLLILPKHHIENIAELLILYPDIIRAMTTFSKNYIGERAIEGENIFGLFIGTCPTHKHLHLQLLCGQELSLKKDHTPGDGSGSGR